MIKSLIYFSLSPFNNGGRLEKDKNFNYFMVRCAKLIFVSLLVFCFINLILTFELIVSTFQTSQFSSKRFNHNLKSIIKIFSNEFSRIN